jgi:chloramphenicol-sensitive protein RarD
MPIGPLAAALAYVFWGVFPIYIKQVAQVPALEVVIHRSVGTLVLMFALLAVLKRLAWLRELIHQPRTLLAFGASTLLLSTNWLLYVWAVSHDRVLDASLGYFINPLVNVVLGYFVLHERPRRWQWVAVGVAAAGVLWLTLSVGQMPWVSLGLALSFGFYGLLRKTATLGAMEGLALETLMLAPLALPALIWLSWTGNGAFGHGDLTLNAWLLAAGPLTAVPLVLFAVGARRVTLATLGLLQYLGPSIQFLLGVFLYHEAFQPARGIGFALIWTALAIYSAEGAWQMKRRPQ